MQEILQPIFGGRPVRPDQLHLTLKFLGETLDAELPRIVQNLQSIRACGPLQLSTDGVVCFPPHKPVRIVAASLQDADRQCANLQTDIDRACHDAGFPLEARRWTPHITLIRVKQHTPSPVRAAAGEAVAKMSAVSFDPDEFLLFESRLDSNGPTYASLAKFAVESL